MCVRVCACVRVVGGWWDVHGPPLLQTHTARTKLNLRRIRYSAFGIRLPRDDSQGTGVPALSSGRTGVRLINKLNIAKDDDVTAHRVRGNRVRAVVSDYAHPKRTQPKKRK